LQAQSIVRAAEKILVIVSQTYRLAILESIRVPRQWWEKIEWSSVRIVLPKLPYLLPKTILDGGMTMKPRWTIQLLDSHSKVSEEYGRFQNPRDVCTFLQSVNWIPHIQSSVGDSKVGSQFRHPDQTIARVGRQSFWKTKRAKQLKRAPKP